MSPQISSKLNSLASQLRSGMNQNLIPGIQAQLFSLVKEIKSLEEENSLLKAKFQEPESDK